MDHLDSLRNLLLAIECNIATKRQQEDANPDPFVSHETSAQAQLDDDMTDSVLNYFGQASLADLQTLRLRVCRSGLQGLDAALGQMSGG